MWQFFAMIAIGVGAVLLVMMATECYIRARILRRRRLPDVTGVAEQHRQPTSA